MKLQLALIILGLVLIGLVFAISRYPDAVERLRSNVQRKIRSMGATGQAKHRNKQKNKSKRGSHREPVFGDADTRAAEGVAGVASFDTGAPQFDPDSGACRAESQGNVETLSGDAVTMSQGGLAQQSAVIQTSLDLPEVEIQEPEITTLKPVEEVVEPSGPFTSLRQIDYWIKLSPAVAVSQADIKQALEGWSDIAFPVQIHALTQEAPHWVDINDADANTKVVDVVASYQLLDAGKASSIDDLKAFNQKVGDLGALLNAEKLMMASPEQALVQSQRLEKFYFDSHGPLEVSVCAPAGQAFIGKLVETSAKQQGLDYLDGEYVRLKRMASDSIILYRMRNDDAPSFDQDMSSNGVIQSVRFSMNPALSQTPGRDAKEMLDAVKAFASRVKGDIRIPGKNTFHSDQLLNLRNRVSKLEKDMIQAGLEPGSQEIKRIFS